MLQSELMVKNIKKYVSFPYRKNLLSLFKTVMYLPSRHVTHCQMCFEGNAPSSEYNDVLAASAIFHSRTQRTKHNQTGVIVSSYPTLSETKVELERLPVKFCALIEDESWSTVAIVIEALKY